MIDYPAHKQSLHQVYHRSHQYDPEEDDDQEFDDDDEFDRDDETVGQSARNDDASYDEGY